MKVIHNSTKDPAKSLSCNGIFIRKISKQTDLSIGTVSEHQNSFKPSNDDQAVGHSSCLASKSENLIKKKYLKGIHTNNKEVSNDPPTNDKSVLYPAIH